MALRSFIRGAVLALAFTAAQAGVASAATTTVVPSAPEARTFETTNGGWTSSVDYGGLVCIPGVTCPTATPSYRSSGGLGGVADGHLRQTFGTLLGVLNTTTIGWTSPSFVAPSGTDAAGLQVQIRPQIASLLAIGSVAVRTRIVDVADPAQSFDVATTPLTAASASFSVRQLTVDPAKLVAGRSYQIEILTSFTNSVSAVTSGNVDLDSVVLTLDALQLPLNLTGTFSANALSGTVETNGSSTDVSVEYGPTAAYGSTTTPVTVSGTGSRPFDVPLSNLTPGATYHYRIVATNADGTVRTAASTFVAAVLPEDTVPLVTGADNHRARTVTFSRAGDVSLAKVEILDGALSVVDTILDAGDDGTQTITLPDADGTYGIRVVRTNLSALSSTSATVSAVLDRLAPAVGAAPTVDGTPDALTVRFARPKDAKTAAIEVLDAAGTVLWTVAVPTGDHATVQLPAAAGVYGVRVVLADAAGNVARTEVTHVTRAAEVVPPPPAPPAPPTSVPPTAPPTRAPAPAQLAEDAPARIALAQDGNTFGLPITCPPGDTCEVSGTLRITAAALTSRARASAAREVLVSRFSGLKIRGEKTKNAKLRISSSFVRRAQRAGLRTVRATLTIRTVRGDGSVATHKNRLTLTIPKAERAAPAVRPKFTG